MTFLHVRSGWNSTRINGRQRGQSTVAISHASILTPFLMGSLLALLLYPIFEARQIRFTNFALFLGVSMSVTAFPVLARILNRPALSIKTRMGTVALTCAAVDDITAWCLLAFVVSIARAESAGAMRTVVLAATYLGAMLLVVRPATAKLSRITATAAAYPRFDGGDIRRAACCRPAPPS